MLRKYSYILLDINYKVEIMAQYHETISACDLEVKPFFHEVTICDVENGLPILRGGGDTDNPDVCHVNPGEELRTAARNMIRHALETERRVALYWTNTSNTFVIDGSKAVAQGYDLESGHTDFMEMISNTGDNPGIVNWPPEVEL
jgi:hypothetical protein